MFLTTGALSSRQGALATGLSTPQCCPSPINLSNQAIARWDPPGLENTALQVSLWLSEKQKKETLKYLIHDSAEAFEPCNEGFASTIHSPSTEAATQTAVIQITSDSRNWFSFLFFFRSWVGRVLSRDLSELLSSFILVSLQATQNVHPRSPRGHQAAGPWKQGGKGTSRNTERRMKERKQRHSTCIFKTAKFN